MAESDAEGSDASHILEVVEMHMLRHAPVRREGVLWDFLKGSSGVERPQQTSVRVAGTREDAALRTSMSHLLVPIAALSSRARRRCSGSTPTTTIRHRPASTCTTRTAAISPSSPRWASRRTAAPLPGRGSSLRGMKSSRTRKALPSTRISSAAARSMASSRS